MIFEYLYLKDFMKIKEMEFQLSPSEMIILSGGNGQGKSAVFEAMALILTGHRKGSSVKHYIRRGQKKFNLKAQVRKSLDSPLFEINMTCSHSTMPPVNKVVTYEGISYQNSEYDTFMKTHFDVDLISNITLTMQGENNLASFKPAQLRDLLKTVFKISFDKEQEQTHHIASHYRERASSLDKQIKSINESLEILKKDEPILYRPPSQKAIDNKRAQYEQAQKRLSELEGYTGTLEDLENQYKDISNQAADKWKQVKRYEAEHNKFETNLENLQTKVTEAQKRVESLDEELNEFSVADSNAIYEEIEDLKGSLMELRNSKHNLEHKLNLLDKGSCPTCNQTLPEDWVSNKDEFSQKLKTIETSLQETSAQIQKYKDLMSQLGKVTQSKQDALKQLEVHQSQLDFVRESFDRESSQKNIDEYKEKARELDNQAEVIAKDVAERRQEMEGALKERDETAKKVRQLKEELDTLENNRRSYEAKVEILNDNNARKEEIENRLTRLTNEDVEVHQDLEVYEVAERLVDKYLPTFGVLTAGEKVVNGMTNIIRPVIPTWDIRLSPSRDGVYFEYRENEEDEWSPISMASGFENALCNIAFKMNLTAYYGLPLMILDEVDSAAVDDNSYRVFDSITQFKRAYNIHQIWLVSHKGEVLKQLISEYGEQIQMFSIEDGEMTHTWKGGATQ